MQAIGPHMLVAGVFGELVPDCIRGQMPTRPCWALGTNHLERASITTWQVALGIIISTQLQAPHCSSQGFAGGKRGGAMEI